MVLESCETCMAYWLKHGRNMAGYRYLARDQHIPEAHLRIHYSRPPSAKRSPTHHQRDRMDAPFVTRSASSAQLRTFNAREKAEDEATERKHRKEAEELKAVCRDLEDQRETNRCLSAGRTNYQAEMMRSLEEEAEEAELEAVQNEAALQRLINEAEAALFAACRKVKHLQVQMKMSAYNLNLRKSFMVRLMEEAEERLMEEAEEQLPQPENKKADMQQLIEDAKLKVLEEEVRIERLMKETEAAQLDVLEKEAALQQLMDQRAPLRKEEEPSTKKDEIYICLEEGVETPSASFKGEDGRSSVDPGQSVEIIETDASWHFQLYKAAMSGDWKNGEEIFRLHTEALKARIRRDSETALHVAVGSGVRTTLFVQEMLKLLNQEDLELPDKDGCTPLGIAAKVGNVEAAKLLVAKHPNLLYMISGKGRFPIHNAAEYGQKEMLLYLLQVTKEGQSPDPYDSEFFGPELLRLIIKAEFYDAALILLKRQPKLATSGNDSNLGLTLLAKNPSVFSFGRGGGLLAPFIYTCVPRPQKKKMYHHSTQDIENGVAVKDISDNSYIYWRRYVFTPVWRMLHQVLWRICEEIAPLLKITKTKWLKRHQAEKLVKCLCREAANNLKKSSDAALLFKFPLLLAAENGIHEIVKEVTQAFPNAIWFHDDNNSEVFRLAIENRHHNVFNLIHEMGDLYTNIVRQSVENGDNILHLAGKLAPPHRLRMISGAALQMQRELQWFKEIEKLVQPAYRCKRNNEGKTPQEVFTESHHELMVEGEKWMKDTANSCTVAAALIATIVFAAAITVPGGNNGENGQPMFASEKAFIIFGVADALSLFSSSASILMFLSILTCRYAERDFLRALPKRLIIGLFALFLSIASMMVAFSSTLYLIFGYHKRWILSSVIASSCLPVGLFAAMQFSLLAEMISSTYGSGIFKKRAKS